MPQTFLTTAETAKRLGIHGNTLIRWRRLGTGPAFIRVGRQFRYDPLDVQAWVESNKQPGDLVTAESAS